MKRVVIESPYAGDRATNDAYLEAAMRDSFARGEAPFASHRLYPGILDDDHPSQRRLGMEAGFAWGAVAELVAVYTDIGITPGMREGIERAVRHRIPVEYRTILEDAPTQPVRPVWPSPLAPQTGYVSPETGYVFPPTS